MTLKRPLARLTAGQRAAEGAGEAPPPKRLKVTAAQNVAMITLAGVIELAESLGREMPLINVLLFQYDDVMQEDWDQVTADTHPELIPLMLSLLRSPVRGFHPGYGFAALPDACAELPRSPSTQSLSLDPEPGSL